MLESNTILAFQLQVKHDARIDRESISMLESNTMLRIDHESNTMLSFNHDVRIQPRVKHDARIQTRCSN